MAELPNTSTIANGAPATSKQVADSNAEVLYAIREVKDGQLRLELDHTAFKGTITSDLKEIRGKVEATAKDVTIIQTKMDQANELGRFGAKRFDAWAGILVGAIMAIVAGVVAHFLK